MHRKNQPESSSSSRSPYPLRNVDEGYVFETDFGVTYAINFTDDSGYVLESSFSSAIFSFSITPIVGEPKQKDPRVAPTILKALHLTFETLPNAVINYVCSLEDDQEVARSRLFDSWFHKVGRDDFVKLDYLNNDDRIYASVIFRRNHPDEEVIRIAFNRAFAK